MVFDRYLATPPRASFSSRIVFAGRLALLTTVTIATLSGTAHAQWPAGGRGYSGGFAVSDGSGNLISRGGFVKYDTTGAILWSLAPPGPGTLFDMVPDGAGGAMFAYTLFSSPGLFAGRLTTTGTLQWSGVQLTSTGLSFNPNMNATTLPDLATDAAGNGFAAWKASPDQRLFAGKVSASGVPQWGATGVLISDAANNSSVVNLDIVPDESGGCYVVWEDFRAGTINGPTDVYVQRITSAGTVAWAANGIAIASGTANQGKLTGCSDGSGGVIMAWTSNQSGLSYDVYVQRVDGTGASLWTAGGLRIYTDAVGNPQDQVDPIIVADGSGGAFVVWPDGRNFGSGHGLDIYMQRINSSGAPQWGVDGIGVFTSTNTESAPRIALDGTGGVFVGCSSAGGVLQHLTGAGTALWLANGVKPSTSSSGATDVVPDAVGGCYFGTGGNLARAFPNGKSAWARDYQAIATVNDVPGDEGGWARLSFNRPAPDGGPVFGQAINAYSIWRKRPGTNNVGPARLHDPRAILARIASDPSVGSYLTGYTDFPAGTWDVVDYTAVLPAVTSYSFLVPTHADSTFPGPANDDFVVLSLTPVFGTFAVSPAFTGHSIDNLAPGAPQNLTGGRSGDGVLVQWSPRPENDLWHYAVYRGTSPSFVPSPGNRIGQPTTASLQDDGFEQGISHYKVSAFDRHGNESSFALLTPSQIVSVPPGMTPARTYISAAMPNPFRELTALEFGVAHRSNVVIEIYDLSGRRVRSLVDESRDPGVYRAVWDGTDDTRHAMGGGVYLARFEADGQRKSLKLVRVE